MLAILYKNHSIGFKQIIKIEFGDFEMNEIHEKILEKSVQ